MKKFFLILSTSIFFFGCEKKDNQSTSEPDVFYFKGSIDGTSVNWTILPDNNVGGYALANTGNGIFSNDCLNYFCREVSEGATIYANGPQNNQPSNGLHIYFKQATRDINFDHSEIRTWLRPGRKSFGLERRNINSPIQDGIIINYVGPESHGGGSSLEWGDQDGSYFESIELKDASPDKPYEKTWKVNFSCKLYSLNGCWPNTTTTVINITGEAFLPVFAK